MSAVKFFACLDYERKSQLLTRLPGIGPVTAEAIVQYRQSNGLFKSHEELTGVKGIGSKTLARLKPYLQQI